MMNEQIEKLAWRHLLPERYSRYGETIEGDHYEFEPEELQEFAELIVRQCGYYADVFESLGCPVDMDPTETKPSDYIKKQLGIENEQV